MAWLPDSDWVTQPFQEIIKNTCDAIWEELAPTELKPPTAEDWQRIEARFAQRWNFPNCVGALDGKHIVIQAPNNSGTMFYNSSVLMALVDADYKFTHVDIGDYGSNSDGGIVKNSKFGQAFMNNELGIPGPKTLDNLPEGGVLPHCIVADKAFPLRCDLMRPYPMINSKQTLPEDQKIFNYRLSRARRIVENAFGILAQRWRIFNRRINLLPKNVDRVVKACVILHNYLTEPGKDLHEIHRRLNPDQHPYLQDNGAILDTDHFGFANARAIRNLYTTYPGQKDLLHGNKTEYVKVLCGLFQSNLLQT